MKMPDQILVDRIKTLLRESTVEYQGKPETLTDNAKKTGLGIAGLALLYFVPGPQPLLDVLALGYTGIKGYQAFRDWLS